VRALSFGGQQDHSAGAEPLSRASRQTDISIRRAEYEYAAGESRRKLFFLGSWLLTMTSAVMDSFSHRFSSMRWPRTMQAQSSATNRLMETTEAWSEVELSTPRRTRCAARPGPIMAASQLSSPSSSPPIRPAAIAAAGGGGIPRGKRRRLCTPTSSHRNQYAANLGRAKKNPEIPTVTLAARGLLCLG
jgi:hypothetical protein